MVIQSGKLSVKALALCEDHKTHCEGLKIEFFRLNPTVLPTDAGHGF